MATGPGMPFEVPPEMRAFAEQSVEQAKAAFDKLMTATQTAMSTMEGQSKAAQANAKDMGSKTVAFAEQNMAAYFDYAQKLMQARDPQSFVQLHTAFIQDQMKALSEQAKALGDTATRAAMDSVRPKT